MVRPTRPPCVLTPRQGEALKFIIDWAGERGIAMDSLPPDWKVARALQEAFGGVRWTWAAMVVALRAAGCFGNPTDARCKHLADARRSAMSQALSFLEEGGYNGDERRHAESKRIAALLRSVL